jgi:Zn ribbon nucleic-acid-binding protein
MIVFKELDTKIQSHIPLNESEFDKLDEHVKNAFHTMARELRKHDPYEGPCTLCGKTSPKAKFSVGHRKCNKCRNLTRSKPKDVKTSLEEENKILLAAIKRLAV